MLPENWQSISGFSLDMVEQLPAKLRGAEKTWKRPGSAMHLHVRWQGKEYHEVERVPPKEK